MAILSAFSAIMHGIGTDATKNGLVGPLG